MQKILAQTILHSPWERIGVKPHHGLNFPLSAIRSQKSCGIGEFFDLIPLINWCQNIGIDVIQLLPVNDSGENPSPYFPISAFALNPIFLSLHKLPHLNEDLQKKILELHSFNESPRVQYQEVYHHKLFFLRQYFEQNEKHFVQTQEFEIFVNKNPWLERYALFKFFKEVLSQNPWINWSEEYKNLSEKTFQELKNKHKHALNFFIFAQYLCFLQLKEIHTYANQKGIFLSGDIPILISPDSADVWQYPEEFDLSLGAGSPPDEYSKQGQTWGLPLYRWDVSKKRDFSWWKFRLQYASLFYDIYRIDHALGFFRIWAIPPKQEAHMGQFIPHDTNEWIPLGKEILSTLVKSNPMLPIAEDLGPATKQVRETLAEMGICRTILMRWERDKENHTFINIQDYTPLSTTTLSTHDSETLTQWWKDFPEEAKVYASQKGWPYHHQLEKNQRRELLWESHHSASLFHINLLGEYLALFPDLVWENPQDERINVPGTFSPNNWTYRIRPRIETLLAHEELAQEIRTILTVSKFI